MRRDARQRPLRDPALGRPHPLRARAPTASRHELDVFVDPRDPVKFSLLTLTNDADRPRRLSVFAYNEWVLGPPRPGQHLHVATERDPADGRHPRPQRLQPRLRRARGLRPRQRAAALRHRRPHGVPRPQRLARPARRPCAATALVRPLRRRPRPLRGAARARSPSRRARSGASCSCSARAGTSPQARALRRAARSVAAAEAAARGRAAGVGRRPRRRPGEDARTTPSTC